MLQLKSVRKQIKQSLILFFVLASIIIMAVSGCTTSSGNTHYIRAIIDGTIYQWSYLATDYSWHDATIACSQSYTTPLAKYYLSTARRDIFAHEAADQNLDIARLLLQIGDSTIDRGCTVDSIVLQSSTMGERFIGTNLIYGTGYTESKPDQTCTTGLYSLTIPYKQQTVSRYLWSNVDNTWESSGTAILTHLYITTSWYGGL